MPFFIEDVDCCGQLQYFFMKAACNLSLLGEFILLDLCKGAI